MTLTEAKEAAGLWGAELVRPLKLRENEVYEIAEGGRRAALRLHRVGYQSDQAIRSELWWADALARAGLPVSSPIVARDLQPFATLSTGRLASVVTWVEGAPLGEAGTALSGSAAEKAGRHHAIGRLLAELHLATDRLDLPSWFTRPSWDMDGLIGEAPLWGRFWDHPLLSAQEKSVLTAARSWLRIRLTASKSPSGLIHADVLRENVFVNDRSLFLIDFDDSGFGFRWYDLGTVLSQDLYEADYHLLRQSLIEGYSSLCAVDGSEVDAFTLARTLASVGWAMTRLPPDHPVQKSHISRAVKMSVSLL